MKVRIVSAKGFVYGGGKHAERGMVVDLSDDDLKACWGRWAPLSTKTMLAKILGKHPFRLPNGQIVRYGSIVGLTKEELLALSERVRVFRTDSVRVPHWAERMRRTQRDYPQSLWQQEQRERLNKNHA